VIVGFGVDLVETTRVAKALARFGDRFVHRILTEPERARAARRDLASTVAKYFCAKEAAGKALGTGVIGPVHWQHIVIEHRPSGRPMIRFEGPAAARFEALGANRAHVTISDERNFALAVVILERVP